MLKNYLKCFSKKTCYYHKNTFIKNILNRNTLKCIESIFTQNIFDGKNMFKKIIYKTFM